MKIRDTWTADDVRDLIGEMEQGYNDFGVLVVNPLEVIEGVKWLLAYVENMKAELAAAKQKGARCDD